MSIEAQNFHRPVQLLLGNREYSTTGATPPDRKHYVHAAFLWDSMLHAIVYAKFGQISVAAQEVDAILQGQDLRTGFIPNMRYGKGRRFDPERLTFNRPGFGSDYTQPPLVADAVDTILGECEKLGQEKQGYEFLQRIYPQAKLFYEYFINYRKGLGSNLVGVIHPHETGRDSDHTFDFIKFRLGQPPRGTFLVRGAVDRVNTITDYTSALYWNLRHRINGWDIKKAREIFWVEDVMFNAIYAQNLNYLARLAGKLGLKEDEAMFATEYQLVVGDILEKMWDPKDARFWARNKHGNFIKVESVSNLFSIILPGISEEQLGSILDQLENEEKFATPFPVPSIPADSRCFDPDYSEKRIWRGMVWLNMNKYIVDGCLLQSELFRWSNSRLSARAYETARTIAVKSLEMVDAHGYWEHYKPYTGEGKRVRDFGWSTVVELFRFDGRLKDAL